VNYFQSNYFCIGRMQTFYSMNTFPEHHHIGLVSSFPELIKTKFQGNMNAVCWERTLEGDFQEIVSKLTLKESITEVFTDDLLALDLSEKGNNAREIIMQDILLLSDFGAQPSLNLLKSYERDDEFDFISTDVYSYHADRSPIETATFLCTYYGAASEIIPNDQCSQKILIPEIREKLKKLYDGSDEGFETFLKDNFFDLHYAANEDAKPVNLGTGNLWRLAVDHPGQSVLPCIHRAPKENPGEYRLLLIC